MGADTKLSKLSDTHARDDAAAVWVDVEALSPWVDNPRKNDHAVKKIAESIKRFGFASPIIARTENGEVIAGHTRLKAAIYLKMRQVPVRYLDISEREGRLLALADNKLGELSEWDEEALGRMLSGFSLSEAEGAGWDFKELGKLSDNLFDDPKEPKINTVFLVSIECEDEDEQIRVLSMCQEQGLKCRASI